MPEEIKIIVTHKDNTATVGIQRTNTDPVFFKVAGSILDVANAMPNLLAQASQKWQTSAKNPVTTLNPPPVPVTTRTVTPPKPIVPKSGMNPML
ncbi:MAG: hypothetical protein PHU23_00320 [Dehalococcoidales bacterium]|nr:hypothetical protein [Dehalococcoidales bacterium]